MRWIEPSGSRWNDKVDGSDCSNFSLGGDFISFNPLFELKDRLISEDESNLSLEFGQKSL